jgi:serine/threonine protein kinase
MSEFGPRGNTAEIRFPLPHPGKEIPVTKASRIGPYPVGEVLGRGGSATIVRSGATALKVFNGEAYRPADFQTEVQTLSALQELGVPHVIPLVDYGVAHIDNNPALPEVPYLALPVAEGGSLKDVLAERTLKPGEVVSFVTQAAETLRAMHENGIVHRDLKPDQVLFAEPLDSENENAPAIWFADLEAAGPVTEFESQEMQKGSEAYAAPEQFGGKNGPQTDIYGLGEVVYEAITGERLWKDGTKIQRVEIMKQRRHDAYVADRLALIGDEYASFIPALRRALKRNLADRYQRVESFAEDILLDYKEAQGLSLQEITVFENQQPVNA